MKEKKKRIFQEKNMSKVNHKVTLKNNKIEHRDDIYIKKVLYRVGII